MKEHQKKFWVILIAITIVALGIRLLAGWQMYNNVPGVTEPIPETDMHTYLKYAEQFNTGSYTDFDGAYYYQPFYYAVFLNILFAMFGGSILSVVISQAFLGALTVFFTGLLGAKLLGRKSGLLAAIILALFRNHILYTPYALVAILQTFLITVSIYCVILSFERKRTVWWIVSGVLFSCSILCRGNFLLVVPIVLLFIFLSQQPWRKRLLYSTVFLMAVYVPQLPFSLKNYDIKKEWTGPSIAGGTVLSIGNNPDAPPGTINMDDSHYIIYDEYQEVNHWPKDELNEKVKAWIFSEPLQWLELKARMLLLYFSHYESFNNTTLAKNTKHVSWLAWPVLIDYWVVSLFFLSSLFRFIFNKPFKNKKILFTYLVSLTYIGSVVLFYILSRYKVPLVPIMCIFTGAEIFALREVFLSNPSRKKVFLEFSRVIVAIWIVYRLFNLYRETLEPTIHRFVAPEGRVFETNEAKYFSDGNLLFYGGWLFNRVETTDVLQKTFVDKLSKPCRGLLRLYMGAKSSGQLTLRIIQNGKLTVSDHTFPYPKGDWLAIPVDLAPTGDEQIEFIIEVKTTSDLSFCFTPQRNYQRSMLNGKLIDGEWIMQLKVFKEKE
ncbi:MAG: glycosyltransferase family 39 protein [Lentisphaeraceae bacterium]|nr:glycosyltransferase family 39 protein [Lentisphaeraceae bacterium]